MVEQAEESLIEHNNSRKNFVLSHPSARVHTTTRTEKKRTRNVQNNTEQKKLFVNVKQIYEHLRLHRY